MRKKIISSLIFTVVFLITPKIPIAGEFVTINTYPHESSTISNYYLNEYEYKVKTGDIKEWEFTKCYIEGKNETKFPVETDSGEKNATWKKGTRIKIEITEIKRNKDSYYEECYGKISYDDITLKVCRLDRSFNSFIRPTINNRTYWEKYVEEEKAHSYIIVSAEVRGDEVIIRSEDVEDWGTLARISVWNWKTGWMEREYNKEIAANGTVLTELDISSSGSKGANIPGYEVIQIISLTSFTIIIYRRRKGQ